jgi:DNA-binding CsgD family transcriptional regulator
MMVITDPDADCWSGIEEVAAIYGLTRRECSLVLHLAQGYTLKEAARRMDVQETTARNHLARAIARTGAKGQSGLMQLLLRSRVPVR